MLKASRTLNADQFFVHASMSRLAPGTEYHYRFRYASGSETGATPDATFITAPGEHAEPFTFTAFADEGIPGPSLDRDPSLLPESDWGEWNAGEFDSSDPDQPRKTGVNTTSAVINQITRVRNLTNGTPSRFNLQAGDLCYAQAQGDIQPIINPNGPDGAQPGNKNTPRPGPGSGGWDYYDPWIWTSWFPMIEASAATIPWMFAINVGVISLDANDLSWEIQGLLGYSDGAQIRWLEDKLIAWRHDPGVDFIVAFFHECAFSTCEGHGSDGGVRARLAPLFSTYQVDLAVQGHNHVYERTNPLIYDAKTNSATSSKQAYSASPSEPAEVEPAKDGTTYVVVGTAGTPRYASPSTRRPATSPMARAAARPSSPTRRRKPARTSTSGTSATPSRRSTGRRPATRTTALSRSTSPRPPTGSGPRWCCGSSISRAGKWTGWSSPAPRATFCSGDLRARHPIRWQP